VTNISLYYLSILPREKAVPKLLEKVVSSGINAIMRFARQEELDKYNDLLWSYNSKSFLPHGSSKDGYPDQQPIYLTKDLDNPSGAKILVLVDGSLYDDITDFERCLDIFDGSDEEELAKARKRYSKYVKDGHNVTLWKQNAQGNWEQAVI
jgi:DNA polymerase-3 subunit chi